ncbi:hypothetical protein [Actinacidiphila glaucinigra]|uniref:hypothetical protein n=1 Tax=Actinacidiphila glaucinigra TaxID=235986 RepID=UPI003721CE6F
MSSELVVQGEDLGAWTLAQRAGWERLISAQQFLLESIGIERRCGGDPGLVGAGQRAPAEPGGDRQLNRAMHTITMVRVRLDPA